MTNALRVLLWTDGAEPFVNAVREAGLEGRVAIDVVSRKDKPTDAQLAGTEAMLAWGVPAGTVSRMPKLRWVQSPTAGVEHWLALPDLPGQVVLTCARGTHRHSMPENILGALFHITKPFAGAAVDQPAHKWSRRMAVPLNGKTLGILGLGIIGQDLAALAKALRMRVIGTRRGGTPLPGLAEVYPPERTPEVLAQSDFVVLLLPATPETDSCVNAAFLSHMKPSAWLLNFGRGHLINDADLIAAAKEKRIAGAMLDVFRQEPLPAEHPFWDAEGIHVLPHVGGGYPGRDADVARLWAENVGLFLDGKPMRQTVDRAAGY